MKIGPYEVLGELGRGGMGVVFRVRAPGGGEAALKLLVKSDQGTLARFEREKRLLASLGEEQGFVGLLDSGSSREGAWLLMPLVPGGTLRQRLEAGPLGVEETVGLGIRLATALGAAHERGIVHRDVKPENVIFTQDGRPLLADLGLAKHFDRGALGASQSASLSTQGVSRGTVGYMAPEQIENAATAGPSADVFALGAVLYECLTGRPAFSGDGVFDVLAKVSSGVFEPIGRAAAPPWLERIVHRALAPDPRKRFADGGTVARALRGLLEEPGIVAKRSRLIVAAALGTAASLALVVIVGLAHRSTAPRAAPAASPAAPGPGSERPPGPSVKELMDRAKGEARAFDWKGEVADMTRVIELEPRLALAWANRGFALGNMEDWDGALADEKKALELDPMLAEAWCDRGWARGHKSDDTDGAIADLSRAIELDATLSRAWIDRGCARGGKGNVDGGIADLTEAIRIDPDCTPAWTNRGGFRAAKGDLDGAIADLTKAIEHDPGYYPSWGHRAVARDRKGELKGAISDYERFLALAADDPKAPAVRRRIDELKAKRAR